MSNSAPLQISIWPAYQFRFTIDLCQIQKDGKLCISNDATLKAEFPPETESFPIQANRMLWVGCVVAYFKKYIIFVMHDLLNSMIAKELFGWPF